MKPVTFSIIIPTYNRKDKIGNTIDSALNQTHRDFEIIVVDDGSTDKTTEFLQDTYPEIRIQRIENSERGAARNRGAEISKGDYIYFLDSDDILYANHLEEAGRFISENNSPEWFFQEYQISNPKGKREISYNRSAPFRSLVERGNFMSCHGVFLRRDIARNNPFIEDRRLAGSEDYELWIRIGLKHKLHINPIVTSELVNHDDRSVYNFNPEQLIQRKLFFLAAVAQNEDFNKLPAISKRKLNSNTFSYIALHIGLPRKSKKQVFQWWWKSLLSSPTSLISKRSIVILKKCLTR